MAGVRVSASPTAAYLLVRLVCAGLARLLFKVELGGLDNLPRAADGRPAGGWIAAGMPHRNWSEPLLLFAMLPARPREIAVAEATTVSGGVWRRLLIRAAGGAIPVGERAEPSAFRAIAQATKRAIEAGVVVTIFPEAGPPSRPPDLRPLSRGVGHLAAHAQVPVVPIVFGGTHELYLRRRIVMRVLPPLAPPPANPDRAAIGEFMAHLIAVTHVAAAELHQAAESDAPRRKRWRWLAGRYPRAD